MKKHFFDSEFFRKNGFKKKYQSEGVSFTLLQNGRSKTNPPILYRITVHVIPRETKKGRETGYLLSCIRSDYNNKTFRAFDGWISTIEDFQDVMRFFGIKRKFKYE